MTTTPLLVIRNPDPEPSELESFKTADEVWSTKSSIGTSALASFIDVVVLEAASVPVNTGYHWYDLSS